MTKGRFKQKKRSAQVRALRLIPSDTENGALKQFNANVEFDVKTASKLEAITGYKYANYKFEVNAEIIGATTTHSSKDHIIYTNAKVNAQYVKKAS